MKIKKLNQKEHIYIYIYKSGKEITIKQDYIGAYGLYLYKDNEYFAISNSFIYLVDYIKKQKEHRITFNKKYADAFITAVLCSYAYSETMVNEIELLDRRAVVNIDIKKKSCEIFYNDYKENTIDIDSKEGIDLVDKWYYKWSNIIYNLKIQNCNIVADLSGGFDSRMAFNVLLGSKCNLNEVFVKSINDELHTHKEDYEIAKAISEYYNFTLNNKNSLKCKCYNYNIDDIINISCYLKLAFHKQMYFKYIYITPKYYNLGGSGGECVRSYWNISKEDYIDEQINRCKYYCSGTELKLFIESVKLVAQKSFKEMNEKVALFGRSINQDEEVFNLYRETRCRNHFGKDMVENYLSGSVKLCPLIDSDLYKLKLNTLACKDKNLLMALIFVRYNKELLDFKFDSSRNIDVETINYAKNISDKYPFIERENFKLNNFCNSTNLPRFLSNRENSSVTSLDNINDLFLNTLNSGKIKNTFFLFYNKILYEKLIQDIKNRKFHPLINAFVIISISKIIQDVNNNECLKINYLSEFMKNQESFREPIDSFIRFDKNLEKYITARIDIKNTRNSIFRENDIEIISISDNSAIISTPEWFHKNGKGYVIESQMGILKISFKCINKGTLTISLRAKDVRDKLNDRVPVWVDYYQFIVNNNKLIEKITPAWHDEPIRYNCDVANGDIINISLEWKPHDFKL